MPKELTTLFTGRNVFRFTVTGSTNDTMAEMLRIGQMPEGTCVISGEQHQGRGQQGAVWFSEPGKNLLVSFVFFPLFLPVSRIPMLNQAVALGVHDYILEVLPGAARIKWPNDIYWGNRKLAGILIENTLNAGGLRQSVVGLGININQESFPAELPGAVSMRMITGSAYSLDEQFYLLCNHLEKRYLQLKRDEYDQLHADYEKALFGKDEWKNFRDAEGIFRGRILGVDAEGKLILSRESGEVRNYERKEVTLLREES